MHCDTLYLQKNYLKSKNLYFPNFFLQDKSNSDYLSNNHNFFQSFLFQMIHATFEYNIVPLFLPVLCSNIYWDDNYIPIQRLYNIQPVLLASHIQLILLCQEIPHVHWHFSQSILNLNLSFGVSIPQLHIYNYIHSHFPCNYQIQSFLHLSDHYHKSDTPSLLMIFQL